jgi:hypothetical protein
MNPQSWIMQTKREFPIGILADWQTASFLQNNDPKGEGKSMGGNHAGHP